MFGVWGVLLSCRGSCFSQAKRPSRTIITTERKFIAGFGTARRKHYGERAQKCLISRGTAQTSKQNNKHKAVRCTKNGAPLLRPHRQATEQKKSQKAKKAREKQAKMRKFERNREKLDFSRNCTDTQTLFVVCRGPASSQPLATHPY